MFSSCGGDFQIELGSKEEIFLCLSCFVCTLVPRRALDLANYLQSTCLLPCLACWLGLGSFSRIVVSFQEEVNAAGHVPFGLVWCIWIGPLGSCLFSLVFLLGTFMFACWKMMFFVE